MTYVSGQTGKQYVVIAAGGHQLMNTRLGDTLIAYALPDVPGPDAAGSKAN